MISRTRTDAVTAYWTKGLNSEASSNTGGWIRLLVGRILCESNREPTGATTADSEKILGIGSNSYFYVGFVHPEFGRQVLAFNPESVDIADFAVSPFDTGALAQNHLRFKDVEHAPVEISDKQEFMRRYSFGADYLDKFAKWAANSYTENPVEEYVEAKQPSAHFCCEISVDTEGSDADCRCWIWEARTPKTVGPERTNTVDSIGIVPVRIWIEDRDFVQLKRWSIRNEGYTVDEKRRILDFLNDNSKVERVTGIDAVGHARKWLEVNQHW